MQPNLQYFSCLYSGKELVFETCINGEGYYNAENKTILGSLYTLQGMRLSTTRIDYTLLVPLPISRINDIFNSK